MNIFTDIWKYVKNSLHDILHPKKYFPEYHNSNSDSDSEYKYELDKKDNRLFKNDILYSEGRLRTPYRGKFHLIANFTIFPYFIYKMYDSSIYNFVAFSIGITNLLIIYLTHIISSFYHIYNFSVENEIIIQKMDYIGLTWYIGSSYYPMALLLFPKNTGIILVICSTVIMYKNSIDIWYSKYSLYRPIFIVGLQIPFFNYIVTYLNNFELICNFTGIFTLVCAAYVMVYEFCPSFCNPKIFGHFEIYHSLSIICLLTTLMMNYSIVSRHTNIIVDECENNLCN
jgi:hypothetical protein